MPSVFSSPYFWSAAGQGLEQGAQNFNRSRQQALERRLRDRRMDLQERQFEAANAPPPTFPVGPELMDYYNFEPGYRTTAAGLEALSSGYSTTQLGEQRNIETAGTEIENRRAQWELNLDQAFAKREREAALRQAIAKATREEIGVEMDRAELDRYTQITGPAVQQAIIEAQREAVGLEQDRLDLQFDQETYESAVAKYEAKLRQQLLQNQINQEEYDQMVALGPTLIRQAQEDLTSTILANRSKELENQFAAATLNDRIQSAQLELQQNQIALQQAEVNLADARRQLAMARRLGPVEEQKVRLEVQRLEEQVQQLRRQNAQAQQEISTYSMLNPDDPDLALKLWEAASQQFREAGMWIPPVSEYMSNMMSSNPLPWPQYVQQYDAELSQILGPAPQPEQGQEYPFEWLKPAWQDAYSQAYDAYYSQFPQYTTEAAPEFPPIEVWYRNRTTPRDQQLSQDQLVEAWNTGNVQITPSGRLVTGRANASQVAQDILNRRPDLSPAKHVAQLRNMTQEEQQRFQENFGVRVADVISALSNM